MAIKDQFTEDMKRAMRSGDTSRRDTLRFLLSAIHNLEIDKQKPADDQMVIELLGKQAQQRRDSIEAFKQGRREDLVAKEENQLAIISEYLPKQMSDEEITAAAQKAIAESGAAGPQDMGKIMGKLMPVVRGKADGRRVNEIVGNLLKSQG